jgi:hypothetical protein
MLMTYKPDDPEPETTMLDQPPDLTVVRDIVGGDAELVPFFETIVCEEATYNCRALCNEHGKQEGLPFNDVATALWDQAMKRANIDGLMMWNGQMMDYLVGNVVVIIGDSELLAAL